ncbi:hypothetical protein ACLOJK_010978 [Asimina triloba]
MEKEPLLASSCYASPRKKLPALRCLPEDTEITLPISSPPITPSALKDLLIFGPAPSDPIPSNIIQPLPVSPCAITRTKTNLHRSKTAPAMSTLNDVLDPTHPQIPKPNLDSVSIVRQAAILLALYLSFGVLIYFLYRDSFSADETHPVVDALYFCIVTMCTIGYGDITPATPSTKIFSILFVLVGFGFIDILLSGMVSYVLDLQENLLLGAVKARRDHGEQADSYIFDVKKGRMRIRMKVGLALGVVVICIGLGTGVMHFIERLGWLDSFYLSVMSVTTVGYGDRAFQSLPGRIFASVWLLVSTLAVARAFLYLAEARIDKRHRMIAKWVLRRDMTVAEFLAADIDNNGFVRFEISVQFQ